jgi:hypothetical protein
MGLLTEHYPAVVTDSDDPQKRGRIKVACAALLGDEDSPLPMWVEPVPQWGWFVVPDVGEIVEVEVTTGSSEDEQPGQMSIDNLDIQWRGQRYYGNTEGDAPTPVPEDFTATNYGKRRGFATPGGHVLLFDDTEGDQKVSLTWHQDGKFSFMSVDKTGGIILSTHSKHLIQLDAENGEIKIWDQHGNMYVSDANRVLVFQKDSNSIEMKSDGNITVLAQSGVTVNGKVCHLNTGEVILGEGLAAAITEFAVLGTTLMTWLTTHIHSGVTTGPGASGPPAVPPTGILSTSVKVK